MQDPSTLVGQQSYRGVEWDWNLNSELWPSPSKAGSHQVNKGPTIQLGSEERGEKPMGENSRSEWAKASPPATRPEQTPGAGTRKGASGRDPPPSTEPDEKRALGLD